MAPPTYTAAHRTADALAAAADPAVLSGSVVLDLTERTDLKDIRLEFTGRSVVAASCSFGERWRN